MNRLKSQFVYKIEINIFLALKWHLNDKNRYSRNNLVDDLQTQEKNSSTALQHIKNILFSYQHA